MKGKDHDTLIINDRKSYDRIDNKNIKEYDRLISERMKLLKKRRLYLIFIWSVITILYLINAVFYSTVIIMNFNIWTGLLSIIIFFFLFFTLLLFLITLLFFAYQNEKKIGQLMITQLNSGFNIYKNKRNEKDISEVIRTYRFLPIIILGFSPNIIPLIYLSFSVLKISFLCLFFPTIILIFLLLSFLIILIIYLHLTKFTVKITNKNIECYVGFGSINSTLSIKRKKIKMSDIKSIIPELYLMPIIGRNTKYFGPYFEGYFLISSLLTVKIITKDDNIIYLRTNDPMRIVNFVRKRIT